MRQYRLPWFATIAVVVLRIAWVGMWISAESSRGTQRGAGSEALLPDVRQFSDAELAKVTGLIAVVDVVAKEPRLLAPIGAPAGVGAKVTYYSLRLLRVLEVTPIPTARTVTMRLEGWSSDVIDGIPPEGTAGFFPNVGTRYLVDAGFYEAHYFMLATGGGFTEITSPEQEAQLVDYWSGLIGTTPEATSTVAESTNTVVGTLGPTELATEPATDTAVPTELPTNAPTDTPTSVPTSAPTGTPTEALTESPTVDAGTNTPTPSSGP